MALNVTTNFNGSDAGQIMTDVFNIGVMFNPANAVQLYNVSNKLSVTMLEDGSFATQPYSCDFVEGDITLTDRTLNPEKFMVTKGFCKSTLWNTWLSFVHANNMNPNSLMQLDANNVEQFTQYVVDFYGKKVGAEIDTILWQSEAGSLTPGLAVISGLVERMLADATVIDVPAPAVLTAANVVTAFEATLALVPSAVLSQPDFAFYINPKTAAILRMGFTQAGFWGNAANGAVELNYLGYRIIVSAGVPDNTIVATHVSNIWVATNISNVEFNVFDKSIVGEDKIGIRGQWVLDTNYAYGKNIVLFTV